MTTASQSHGFTGGAAPRREWSRSGRRASSGHASNGSNDNPHDSAVRGVFPWPSALGRRDPRARCARESWTSGGSCSSRTRIHRNTAQKSISERLARDYRKKMMTHVRYRQVAFLAPHARFGLDFPCFWCRHRFVIEVTGKKIEKSFVKWVDLERRLRHDDASQQF